jgi:3-hydroxybutyryl-CoA dehydrogenase
VADAYMDLLLAGTIFSPPAKPLLLGETIHTFNEWTNLPQQAGRFCAWPGFLERPTWEIALLPSAEGPWLTDLMKALGKSFLTVKDTPGLVSARVIAAIINEACYLLADGTATAADVDTAMKLGTNYPMGPVEWCKKIGAARVHSLLLRLAEEDDSYLPHPLLSTL